MRKRKSKFELVGRVSEDSIYKYKGYLINHHVGSNYYDRDEIITIHKQPSGELVDYCDTLKEAQNLINDIDD